MNFSKRSDSLEIMDDLACQGEVVFQTLRELDFINLRLGGNQVTISALIRCWKKIPPEQEIVIADLGCGSGEILRIIALLARNERRKVKLIGLDANPHIIEYAQIQSKEFTEISFEALNIFSEEFKAQKFDFVLATLFTHHFNEEELIQLFTSLKENTRQAIIVNDIHRHFLAYYSIKWLTAAFSKSAMVQFDAPLSVLRAFKKNEWVLLMKKLKINEFSLKWKWAFRWQLIIPVK
jgi:2-polyprenyl-3-methyl-5-hydroxy-6-metoxy-1,4-benzoquinol methylase